MVLQQYRCKGFLSRVASYSSHHRWPRPTHKLPRGRRRIIPGEEFQYWRWASALSLAVSGSSGEGGEDDTPLRTVMKEVRTYLERDGPSLSQEKNADAVCSLAPAEGLVSTSVVL